MSKAIGIDLGTTNSVVAYVGESGLPEVIPSREGGRTVPSVFSVTESGERLVGGTAVWEEADNATSVVRSVKRLMGTQKRVTIREKEYTPEEVSAEILMKLKADAEEFFGESVTDAVITVPAYFDNSQRQATKTAGEMAGLNVLRVINEPTAASLAYGLDSKKNETVLVYDLGGGTFDVTILEITDDGVFDVKATAGDTRLGGDDFDSVLMSMILDSFNAAQHSRCAPNLRRSGEENMGEYVWGVIDLDASQMTRLRGAAEQAKKTLSSAKTAPVSLPYFATIDGSPVALKATVTRDAFEDAIAPLLERTKECVQSAMRDAGLKAKDIDEVVFVGGSTRVPIVEAKVTEWTWRKPNRSVNPDEVVALGAAIQASILSGQSDRDIVLFDVTPLSMGVETLGGVMTVMIARNSKIPCTASDDFTTATDNQAHVDVRAFQGERPQVKDNRFLGEFALVGIPPAPRGVPKVEVSFTLDSNGILSVKGVDRATGVEQEVVITGASLSKEERDKALEDAAVHAAEDEAFQELTNARDVITGQLHQVEALLRDDAGALDAEAIADLADLRVSLEDSRDKHNIELLVTLAAAARESIKSASALVYAKADEQIAGAQG
jgi:molecular chaperone DnaK